MARSTPSFELQHQHHISEQRIRSSGSAAAGFLAAATRARLYEGRTTSFVAIACIMAASGGLNFGYGIGISGGLTSMDGFLNKFFPNVERNKNKELKDPDYCKYDNMKLTTFISSLYIVSFISSFGAFVITRNYGRRSSILFSSVSFLIGAALSAFSMNFVMLVMGRIMLGVGIGFGNQAVPLYLSEMAPTKLRGALNIMFQLAITIAILAANVINYGATMKKVWGWRLSLGLAAVPATIMLIGGLFLPETPNSLIERGHMEKGKQMLVKIRGTLNVSAEFEDIVNASQKSNAVKHPFKNILEKKNRPQLVMAIFIPFFQQFTGINVIMFYAPVVFKTIGFGPDASLYSSIVTGVVNVLATLISMAYVDKWGRKVLFLEAGVQMFLSQVIIAIVLAEKFGGSKELSKGFAIFVVVLICIYVSAFAWSWGPLGWLVPSEIFALETRSAGQSINNSVNMLFTFVISQGTLAMLCRMKYGIFLFFAGWVLIMTIFVHLFLPETKNVPIEQMVNIWKHHWFWKKIVPSEDLYSGEGRLVVQFPTKIETIQLSENGLNKKHGSQFEIVEFFPCEISCQE